MKNYINSTFIQKFTTAQWWLFAIAFLVISQLTVSWLDSWYAASQFPVPFFVGQTTFDANEYKQYLAVLIEKNTLGIFISTQLIDFIYMATVILSFGALCIAIYLSLPNITWLKNIGFTMIIISIQAASFDALENFVSFIMLADPAHFSDWLIYPYSSFAVIKFFIYSLTYFWAAAAIMIIIIAKANRSYQKIKNKVEHG